MHLIDWLLVLVPLVLVFAVALYTHRYVRSVADFLSAGRCAGRYLLANARGESDSGLANTMSKFQIILVSGFVLNFWEKISVPVLLLVGISGFVVYRFRETRALTLAQFLEARYSRGFRLYMGVLAFISGILNYGIFPAVSARFFVYFLDLPRTVDLLGFEMRTYALIMLVYLAGTIFMILVGGQVTLMVTDCIEGILSHAIYIAIVIAVFFIIDWNQVVEVMSSAKPGYSHINPFDAHEVEDFNFWFIVMSLLNTVYTTMALQNKQGFNSAARNAHESRMGHVLGHWRTYARLLMILLLGVCALTYLDHPDFKTAAVPIHDTIDSIADSQVKKEMTVPIALSYLLPMGIKGLFVAMMVMGLIAGDSGHIHSWGSILVQDVIVPLRKRELSPRVHMWLLRLAVMFVAGFAFVFSLLFEQTQYIALWWALTGGVFTGGAGAVIIGGLYWKKGTTPAAWSAAITGSTLALIGVLLSHKSSWPWVLENLGPTFAGWGVELPAKFWFNGIQTAFIAACVAASVYGVVSLITCRQDYNLEKLLNRGKYAVDEAGRTPAAAMSMRQRFSLRNILKFDSNFTFADKMVSGGIFWWAMLLLGVNILVCIWNLQALYPAGWPGAAIVQQHWPAPWGVWGWSHYWMITAIGFPMLIAVATLIWFTIGGMRDIRDFFHDLATAKRDARDDGRVEHGVVAAPAGGAGAPRNVTTTATGADLR